MSFMQAQLTNRQRWIVVDGPQGTEYLPADDLGLNGVSLHREDGDQSIPEDIAMYCENRKAYNLSREYGYGVRSSAPGYMDCTPWTVYSNLRDATKAYNEEKRANKREDY